MNREDRVELRRLWAAIAAIGVALVLAAIALVVTVFWEARDLDSTIGEVLGTRDVETDTGKRPELLVAFETSGGETMMFAEAIGSLAPEVGDRVLVWYRAGDAPRAIVARQRFGWPALLLPVGLVLAVFGLWRLRRARRSADTGLESDLEDL